MVDSKLAGYEGERDQDNQRIHFLELQGIGQKNPQMIAAVANLQAAEDKIRQRAKQFREQVAPSKAAAFEGVTTEELQARRDAYEKMYKEASDQMMELGKQQLDIEELRARAGQVKQELDEASQAIEHTQVESQMTGRIAVLSKADRPLARFATRALHFPPPAPSLALFSASVRCFFSVFLIVGWTGQMMLREIFMGLMY